MRATRPCMAVTSTVCKVRGCYTIIACAKMCAKHYQRFHRHGDPLHTYKKRTAGKCGIEGCNKPRVAAVRNDVVYYNPLCCVHQVQKYRRKKK